MAPELGLFLDECVYEAYSKQYGDLHEPLRLGAYAARVAAFKAAHLYPHIAARDAEEGVNSGWLGNLTAERYRFAEWPAMAAGRALPRGSWDHKRDRPCGGGGGGGGREDKRARPGWAGAGDGGAAMRATMDAELSE
jgi:hypothetical protein